MAMTERHIDGQYAYGWRFGVGFCAAASVFSLVWLVIGVAVGNAVMNEQMRQVSTMEKKFEASIPKQMRIPQPKKSRVVEVPPGSKEDCFAKTDGVINETFKECITGYSITVDD